MVVIPLSMIENFVFSNYAICVKDRQIRPYGQESGQKNREGGFSVKTETISSINTGVQIASEKDVISSLIDKEAVVVKCCGECGSNNDPLPYVSSMDTVALSNM